MFFHRQGKFETHLRRPKLPRVGPEPHHRRHCPLETVYLDRAVRQLRAQERWFRRSAGTRRPARMEHIGQTGSLRLDPGEIPPRRFRPLREGRFYVPAPGRAYDFEPSSGNPDLRLSLGTPPIERQQGPMAATQRLLRLTSSSPDFYVPDRPTRSNRRGYATVRPVVSEGGAVRRPPTTVSPARRSSSMRCRSGRSQTRRRRLLEDAPAASGLECPRLQGVRLFVSLDTRGKPSSRPPFTANGTILSPRRPHG